MKASQRTVAGFALARLYPTRLPMRMADSRRVIVDTNISDTCLLIRNELVVRFQAIKSTRVMPMLLAIKSFHSPGQRDRIRWIRASLLAE